jgi:hypothetical protein
MVVFVLFQRAPYSCDLNNIISDFFAVIQDSFNAQICQFFRHFEFKLIGVVRALLGFDMLRLKWFELSEEEERTRTLGLRKHLVPIAAREIVVFSLRAVATITDDW